MQIVGWAAAAVLTVVAIWLAWWWAPHSLAKRVAGLEPKERIDVENSYRSAIAQAIGGLALLSGGWFTIQQQSATASAQRMSQYEKGFEGLKGTDVASHIGGAYELESLSMESESFHDLVLGALSGSAVAFSSASRGPGGILPLDAAAALQVVARAENPRRYVYRLAQGSFQGADLGEAHFDGADARQVNFEGANLYKAHLFNANLWGVTFNGANLAGADLSHAQLPHARFCPGLNLAVPQLESGEPVPAQLSGSAFFGANVEQAWFIRADLSGARFSDAKGSKAHFGGALLYQADFDEASLAGADFGGSDARGAHFNSHAANGSGAHLASSSFRFANLRGAEFKGADLSGADFGGADLSDADLSRAGVDSRTNFKGARLCGARLPPSVVESRNCDITPASPPAPPIACPTSDQFVLGIKKGVEDSGGASASHAASAAVQ